jgi:hypothetical protein
MVFNLEHIGQHHDTLIILILSICLHSTASSHVMNNSCGYDLASK